MDFRRVHFSDEVKVCNDKENNWSKLLKTKQNHEPQQEDPSEQTDIQEQRLIEDDTKQHKGQKRVIYIYKVCHSSSIL